MLLTKYYTAGSYDGLNLLNRAIIESFHTQELTFFFKKVTMSIRL